ncbi:olfactory receptor 1L1-like isoform X2 [Arvicanthis niloticus]|uniref:olfactory receptor 1L1-like isoform X2 n=1 Tax=Arvicanthis niloticus TaxID=61156 RepID=UPI00402B53EE
MATENRTEVTEFVLLGLSSRPEMQPVIFGVVLIMYLMAVLGNTLLVLVACSDPKLQTPMYFLLSQLSLIDISLTTIIVPQMLVHTLSVNRTISYNCCMTQLFSFMTVGSMEVHLLGAMAYDRYVAICDPLRYSAIVSHSLCLRITLTSLVVVSLNSLLYSVLVTRLTFCGNQVTHFFCDITPLLKLSCTRPVINEMLIFTEGVAVVPSSSYNLEQDRQVAIFYTLISPMLNPLIYSLRNQEVKGALRRLLRKLHLRQLPAWISGKESQ